MPDKRKIAKSLKARLMLLFLAVSLIPIALVGYFNFASSVGREALQESRIDALESIAQLKVDEIEGFFEGLRRDLKIAQKYDTILRNLPVVSRHIGNRAHPAYRRARAELDNQLIAFQRNKKFDDVLLIDPQGVVVYAANKAYAVQTVGAPLSDIDGASAREGPKGIYYSDIFQAEIRGSNYDMLLVAPVDDDRGNFLGLIAFEIDMDPVYEFIQGTTGLGETGETLIARDEGGHALFLNPLRHDPHAALSRMAVFNDSAPTPVQEAVTGGSGRGVSLDYRGKEVLAVWKPVQSRNWGLVAKIDTDEVYAPVFALRRTILIVGLVTGVVVVLLSVLFSRSLSRPIERLKQTAERIGAGERDTRVDSELTGLHDEIGDLSRSFDQMTEDLRKTTVSRDELAVEVEERKKFEAALRVSNQDLEEFAYVVSHDLKAPMRGISSLSEWLGRDYKDRVDEKGQKYLRLLNDRSQRMIDLIDGILLYSRVGRKREERRAVDLNQVAANAIDLLDPPDNLKIEVVSTLPTLNCEEVRIGQVFQNLISNAIKYIDKPRGTIRIDCIPDGGFYKFSVSDNGPGIEEQYLEKIFQLFQTLQSRDQSDSTGVGLAVVQKIVRVHGGDVSVESTVGEGSTFYFTLPKSPEERGEFPKGI